MELLHKSVYYLVPISRFTLTIKSLKTHTALAHLQQLSSASTHYPLAYRLLKFSF